MHIAYVVILPYLGLFATVLTLLWFVLYREVAAGLVLAVVLEVTAQLHHLVQVSLEEEMFLVDSKRDPGGLVSAFKFCFCNPNSTILHNLFEFSFIVA